MITNLAQQLKRRRYTAIDFHIEASVLSEGRLLLALRFVVEHVITYSYQCRKRLSRLGCLLSCGTQNT